MRSRRNALKQEVYTSYGYEYKVRKRLVLMQASKAARIFLKYGLNSPKKYYSVCFWCYEQNYLLLGCNIFDRIHELFVLLVVYDFSFISNQQVSISPQMNDFLHCL